MRWLQPLLGIYLPPTPAFCPPSCLKRLYFPKCTPWHPNQGLSWPRASAQLRHLSPERRFYMIVIQTRHPTPGLLKHDGMFYIGHNAINYFFDGSLFVMLINAGVPPPSLLHGGWNAFTISRRRTEAVVGVTVPYCVDGLHTQALLSRCTFHPQQRSVSFKKWLKAGGTCKCYLKWNN